ncbi:lipid-A-disaccharide synthase [Rickettsia endosymbiont of Culicoides newsteadi]|uniref:lipid-A-disaccharide synthase n=1 Tax=Rickettsia endosymbiont of Culicoides newsteadi TaxID=1961830 RepID=UPI000B9C0010|nr:lipid-A-disaccharide synthase [Rickettsia endosymbiont of Culicoides newsteadi]OZG31750.1 lipid-A-disaccharide synthase [Rickettsia endosymbiont of Culicoides newsteadi]
MVKIYLIAGEISGDFIGSRLMQSLKNLYKLEEMQLEFVGIGGDKMQQVGLHHSLFPISQINLMGFVEIIPHIFRLTKLIQQTIDDIIQHNPDLLITIDSPGFTYRVAKKVREIRPNLKIMHIVAPSVWAYKPSRAMKYAKIYDYLLALLPFEPPYFQKVGLDCRYIGHPILEQYFYDDHDKQQLKQELQIPIHSKLLCITCGSRKSEIIRHAPIFIEAINLLAKQFPNIQVIFVLADPSHQSLIKAFLSDATFNYQFSSDRLKIFAASDLALAKSGTNTLEIAACNTPMVVAYKLNIVSFFLIKLLIKIPYISLINIVANKEILPELIQFNCTKSNIAARLTSLLVDEKKADEQLRESQKILRELGFQGSIVNSGELGSRNDGAMPISNRRALSDDVTNFSSIDSNSSSNVAAHIIKSECLTR